MKYMPVKVIDLKNTKAVTSAYKLGLYDLGARTLLPHVPCRRQI